MKNLDEVIEEIESRLDEKDEVRELTIKSSRTIARLSGSAIRGMHPLAGRPEAVHAA